MTDFVKLFEQVGVKATQADSKPEIGPTGPHSMTSLSIMDDYDWAVNPLLADQGPVVKFFVETLNQPGLEPLTSLTFWKE